jgi:hypothetical protein
VKVEVQGRVESAEWGRLGSMARQSRATWWPPAAGYASNQVVHGQGEAEHPTDPSDSAMARLAQLGDGSHATDDLWAPAAPPKCS